LAALWTTCEESDERSYATGTRSGGISRNGIVSIKPILFQKQTDLAPEIRLHGGEYGFTVVDVDIGAEFKPSSTWDSL
jgi:hypothetical protein